MGWNGDGFAVSLSTLPIMQASDWEKEFYVNPSVVDDAIGAMLLQRGKESQYMKLVHYASRAKTLHERDYSEIELVMTSMVYACRRFRHYLLQKSFTFLTSYSLLPQLFNNSNISKTVMKWVIELQEFQFTFLVEESTRATLADLLTYKETPVLVKEDVVQKKKIQLVFSFILTAQHSLLQGYRYELWCIARAAGIRYCVLYCDAEVDTCRACNRVRSEQGLSSYDDAIFEDLAMRFEEPDRRNRWDSPLFHLKLGEETIGEATPGIVEASAFLKGVNETAGRTSLLKPTVATQNAHASDTNSLYELDRATQEVINVLVEAQAQGLGGALGRVDVGEGTPLRPVGLAELRRHRRTYIKLAGQTSLSGPPPPSDAMSAKRMFTDYLMRELSS
ncbi:hypothetical protein L7F22_006019 [Adiantum nelumboides]|nr:hypothetical protein [Adiantum nelumboides]